MAQVNRIRELFFEKGLKYAEISRATGFDVKTVKKYIDMDDFNPILVHPTLSADDMHDTARAVEKVLRAAVR